MGKADEEEKPGTWKAMLEFLQRIPGAALMFAVGPLVILGYFGWYFYGADRLDKALYSLQKENLQVTPQPKWIRSSNVVDEVFENSSLGQLSLLDPTATATIAQAFETHSWIDSTARVGKSSGGRVSVELVYREPRAMVYYENPEAQDYRNRKGFYSVDRNSVVLPSSDFDESDIEEKRHFLVIADGVTPKGVPGLEYWDSRISEAIELCNFLEPAREKLRLESIYVQQDARSMGPSVWNLKVVTVEGHELIWGHAPNREAAGEEKAEAKSKRMIAWLQEARGSSVPLSVDLRSSGTKTRPVSWEKESNP